MNAPSVHADCGPLAFLLGRWEGEGRGLWTAVSPFAYREELVFDHIGKPFLRYGQRTWGAADGSPMHSETGYLRPVAGGGVELLVVQPIGFAEIHAGRIDGRVLDLRLVSLAAAPSAKPLTDVSRRLWVEDDDTLRYWVRMGMNGEPLSDHLEAVLRRVATTS